MNGRAYFITSLIAVLTGCASGWVDLPPSPHRGPPRAVLHMRGPIVRGAPYTIEFGLLGSPYHKELQHTVVYHLVVWAPGGIYRETTFVNPKVSRYFVWTIPGRYTLKLEGGYILVRVEVSNVAGYTYSGTPLFTKPFTQDVARVPVLHPMAGGQLDETSHPAL